MQAWRLLKEALAFVPFPEPRSAVPEADCGVERIETIISAEGARCEGCATLYMQSYEQRTDTEGTDRENAGFSNRCGRG